MGKGRREKKKYASKIKRSFSGGLIMVSGWPKQELQEGTGRREWECTNGRSRSRRLWMRLTSVS